MSGWFCQSMIYLSFPFVVCHRSMSSEYDPQFHSLQIETCTPKLLVKTTTKQHRNFKLPLGWFAGHLNLYFVNSQATIFHITVGDWVQNPQIQSIEVLQWYTIAAWQQLFLARAWYRMSARKKIIQIIHLQQECRHVEGMSFPERDQSWQFSQSTYYESGWSSPHLWQTDSQR